MGGAREVRAEVKRGLRADTPAGAVVGALCDPQDVKGAPMRSEGRIWTPPMDP